MINAIGSLQTNVIATVRRDAAELPNSLAQTGNGVAGQSQKQSDTFRLVEPTPLGIRDSLDSQITELMAVAQASAASAAGIEPKAAAVSAYGRAYAAYERVGNLGYAAAQPLLSLVA